MGCSCQTSILKSLRGRKKPIFTLKVSGLTAGSISENSAIQHARQTETPNGNRFPGAARAGSLLVGNLKH